MLRTILHFQVTLQNPGDYYIPYQPALLKRWFPFPLWWDTLVSGNLPQHLPVNVEATLSGIEGLLQDSVGVGILFEALATLKWWFLKWCSSNLLVTWLRYLLSNYQCSPHFPLNCWRYVVGSRVSLLCQTVVIRLLFSDSFAKSWDKVYLLWDPFTVDDRPIWSHEESRLLV